MGKNNKRHLSNFGQKSASGNNDSFNVRQNLAKLRSGKDSVLSETESGQSAQLDRTSYIPSSSSQIIETTTTISNSHAEKLENRFSTDVSNLRDQISGFKDNFNSEISGLKTFYNGEISDVREKKLDKSDFWTWVGGIIATVILISGIVYALSYQDILSDSNETKKFIREIERKVDRIEIKLEQSENKNSKSKN